MDSYVEKNCNLSADELQAKAVRELNDELRCHQRGGKLFMTRGITALGVGMLPVFVCECILFNRIKKSF